ncbi:hypothetical protein Avi_1469 [Allorhizobium ampelinum S4]|uniref:Uncharacterized protein n=1 Tax=Allorhizobium ampelinum (strain ATCC BAA-846 / DSM 112012 / S4) TaxID=311402 RepID=B9JUQ3_ALLAM|nr:hypothetical protein Avi_1469 [Allorhizobium ampelinum S4]
MNGIGKRTSSSDFLDRRSLQHQSGGNHRFQTDRAVIVAQFRLGRLRRFFCLQEGGGLQGGGHDVLQSVSIAACQVCLQPEGHAFPLFQSVLIEKIGLRFSRDKLPNSRFPDCSG